MGLGQDHQQHPDAHTGELAEGGSWLWLVLFMLEKSFIFFGPKSHLPLALRKSGKYSKSGNPNIWQCLRIIGTTLEPDLRMPVCFLYQKAEFPTCKSFFIFLVSELQACPKSMQNVLNNAECFEHCNVQNKPIRKIKLTKLAEQSHRKPVPIEAYCYRF